MRKMNRMHEWLVLMYIFVVHGGATDFSLADPGLKIRFSKSGLNYGAQTAVNAFTRKVSGMTLPDVTGDTKIGVVGKISYSVTGITLTSFQNPASTVTTDPFGWSLKNIQASLHGNWKYRNHGWVHVSDSGSFDVQLSGWAIGVTVIVGVNKQHRPTVSANKCNCYAGSTKVKFHGGASWLYNLFSSKIEDVLKRQLQGKLCDAVKKVINENGNAQLATMKVTVPVGKGVELDYGLTKAPSFSIDFMESFHKGEIYWTSDKQEAPFSPPPLPEITTNKMVTFWVSEYVINTLGYVDYKHQAIQYNLTKNDLPLKDQGWLNTSCSGFQCIVFFIPQLKKFCANCSIEVHMAVSKAPSLQISKSLSGSFEGALEFYASDSTGKTKFAFSVKTSVAMELNITMKDMRIVGAVKQFSIGNVTLISSNIGDSFVHTFASVMSALVNNFVKPQLNDLMKKGLELPKLDDFQLVDPEIQLVQNAVVVLTNIKYTG